MASVQQEQNPPELAEAGIPHVPRVLGLRTVGAYLIGRREAILGLAACPQALWIGLLLVLSAGFAREYDGEDLLHEPWYLVIPLAASLATSFVLFGLVYLAARCPASASYRQFLTLYWLTAPLAWLYAIPVERMLSAGGATEANLWLLAIVSVWRVALITRVLSVILQAHPIQPFVVVMLFADTVMLALLRAMPMPIIAVMGGVRLTDAERTIQGTTLLAGVLGVISWPLWLTSTLWVVCGPARTWRWAVPSAPRHRVANGVWIAASLAVLGWGIILPFVQPEQLLRRQVERDMAAGRIAEGLDLMSQHARSDFPPHWEPPPHIGYGDNEPPLLDVLDMLESRPVAEWVRDVYWEIFRRDTINFGRYDSRLNADGITELERYQKHLDRMPVPAGETEFWQGIRTSVATAIQDRQAEAAEKAAAAEVPADEQP
jgi:hypothetical protein